MPAERPPARRPPRPARRAGLLLAGLVATVGVTACGADGDEPGSATGSATAPATAGSSAPTPDPADRTGLAAGLLPADAFGEGATVVELDGEQLAGVGDPPDAGDVQISPESCAAAVEGTQPRIADYDDAVAVNAIAGSVNTVEVLLQGDATAGAVDQLVAAVTGCPEATIGSPQLGTAEITFELLEVPDLGDAAAAARYTTTVEENGTPVRVPTLVAIVQDGDRLVTLLRVAADGSDPDEAEFTDLLEQAVRVQADALG